MANKDNLRTRAIRYRQGTVAYWDRVIRFARGNELATAAEQRTHARACKAHQAGEIATLQAMPENASDCDVRKAMGVDC